MSGLPESDSENLERDGRVAPIRLLRTDDFRLEEPVRGNDGQLPKYAILSHTWLSKKKGRDQEVLYADLDDLSLASEKAGWEKVEFAAKEAARDGLQYVWIDSCCIDKTSSAELSESINSMYRWYECASVCYVHLDDMPASQSVANTARRRSSLDLEALKQCRWFTRGWTLQEMIASRHNMKFYDCAGNFLGTLKDLVYHISEITGVHSAMLNGTSKLSSYSVAQRMSWASNRRTTRVEDRAYSLLGIFGISLVATYGEGVKAFARLQEEILKTGVDHTIFAWGYEDDAKATATEIYIGRDVLNLLAESPDAFRGPSCRQMACSKQASSKPEYEVTARSVNIDVWKLGSWTQQWRGGTVDTCTVLLNCHLENEPSQFIALVLLKSESETFSRGWVGSCDMYEALQSCTKVSLAILRQSPGMLASQISKELRFSMRLMFRCSRKLQGFANMRGSECSIYKTLSDLMESRVSDVVSKKNVFFFPPPIDDNFDNGRLPRYLARGYVQLQSNDMPLTGIRVAFLVRAENLFRRSSRKNGCRVGFFNDSEVHFAFEQNRNSSSFWSRLANFLLSSPKMLVLDDCRVLTAHEIEHSLLKGRFRLIELDIRGSSYLLHLLLIRLLFSRGRISVIDGAVLIWVLISMMKSTAAPKS